MSFKMFSQILIDVKTPDGMWIWRWPHPFDCDFTCSEVLSDTEILAGSSCGIMLYNDELGDLSAWQQVDMPEDFSESLKAIVFKPLYSNQGYAISDHKLLQTDNSVLSWKLNSSIEQELSGESLTYISLCEHENSMFLLIQSATGKFYIAQNEDYIGTWGITELLDNNTYLGFDYPYLWTNKNVYEYNQTAYPSYAGSPSSGYTIDQVVSYENPNLDYNYIILCHTGSLTKILSNTGYDINENAVNETNGNPEYDFTDSKMTVVADSLYVYNECLYRFTQNLTEKERLNNGPFITELDIEYDYIDYGIDKITITDFSKKGNARIATTSKSALFITDSEFYPPSFNQKRDIIEYAHNVYFISPEIGYIIQSNNPNNETVIYRTTDSGVNWDIYITIPEFLSSINEFFVSDNDKYCYILDALDRFYSFNFQNNEFKKISLKVNDFMFIDGTTGWFITEERKLFMVDNNIVEEIYDFNNQLDPYENGTPIALNSVCFSSTDNGYVAGAYGFILVTENGGSSWNIVSQAGPEINTIQVVTEDILFAAADDGKLFRALDGGGNADSWEIIELKGTIYEDGGGVLDVVSDIHTIQFWDDHTGYVVTEQGFVINKHTEIENNHFFLKRTPLNLPAGAMQETPSMFVLNGFFNRFIYARDHRVFTSDGFDQVGSYPIIDYMVIDKKKRRNGRNIESNEIQNKIVFSGEEVKPGFYSSYYRLAQIKIKNISSDIKIIAPEHFKICKRPETGYPEFKKELIYDKSEINNILDSENNLEFGVCFAPESDALASYNATKKAYIYIMSDQSITVKLNVQAKANNNGVDNIHEPINLVGIEDIKEIPDFDIFLTNSIINIYPNESFIKPYRFQIYTLLGKQIYQSDRITGNHSIDISHLPYQIYIIKLYTNNMGVRTEKIVHN